MQSHIYTYNTESNANSFIEPNTHSHLNTYPSFHAEADTGANTDTCTLVAVFLSFL